MLISTSSLCIKKTPSNNKLQDAKLSGRWTCTRKLVIGNQEELYFSKLTFESPVALSALAKITKVTWCGLDSIIKENSRIFLCDSHQSPNYRDISTLTEGETHFFNNRCANHKFVIYFYIPVTKMPYPIMFDDSVSIHVDWKNDCVSNSHNINTMIEYVVSPA